MEKFVQFTYGYTKYKCDNTSMSVGGGFFNRTAHSDALDYASNIVSAIRQDFSDESRHLSSFGFRYYQDTPYIFHACSRDMTPYDYVSLRGGEDYMAHVCMGNALTKNGYAIQFYDSTINNFNVHVIDDVARPEFYRELSDSEVQNSRGYEFSQERVKAFQARNLHDLASLLGGILASMETGEKVFVCVPNGRQDQIAQWMAGALMLLPCALANKVSFNTFLPDPTNSANRFNLCGVVLGASTQSDYLPSSSYIYEIGTQFVAKSVAPSSKIADFFAGLNADTFRAWCAFSSACYNRSDITMDDLLFLIGAFNMVEDGSWSIHEKIKFFNENLTHRFNQDRMLETGLFNLINNELYEITKSTDTALLVAQNLGKIISHSNSTEKIVNEALGTLAYLLFESANAPSILARCVDEEATTAESFFGASTNARLVKFLVSPDGLDTVEAGVVKNIFEHENPRSIQPKVIAYLFRLYYRLALEQENTQALEIVTQASRALVAVHRRIPQLFDLAFADSALPPKKILRFLSGLRLETHGQFLIEDSTYLAELIQRITTSGWFLTAVDFFSVDEPSGDMIAALLDQKWTEPQKSLRDISAILDERDRYANVEEQFDHRFAAICKESFGAALDQERQMIKSLNRDALVGEKRFVDSMVRRFDAHNGEIVLTTYAAQLKEFAGELENRIYVEGENEEIQSKRVEHVIRKLRLLPNKAIRGLLNKHQISAELDESVTYEDEKEAFILLASDAFRQFLKQNDASLFQKKIAVCKDVDYLVEKNKRSYSFVKGITLASSNILISAVFSGLVVLLSALVGALLYNTIGNSYFSTLYFVFPVMAAVVSQIIFWYNSTIQRLDYRIILTGIQTLVLIALFFTIYFVGLYTMQAILG